MKYLLLVPLVLLPIAALGMHSAACGMHVWAVDRISNPEARERNRGLFYSYCKFMSAPLETLRR